MGALSNVWLLVRKNYKTKARRWTIWVEIIAPLAFFIIAVFIRSSLKPKDHAAVYYNSDEFVPYSSTPQIIAFAPNTTWGTIVMNTFATEAASLWRQNMGGPITVQGFATEAALVNTLSLSATGYLGGIVLTNLPISGAEPFPKDISYTIRMCDSCTPQTNTEFATYGGESNGANTNLQYTTYGFLALQLAMDSALSVQFGSGSIVNNTDVSFNRYPYPAYQENTFAQGLSAFLPLFMVLAWLFTVAMTVKDVVFEKEKRLKEAMKMMGLTSTVNWLSWWATAFSFILISIVLMTIITKGGKILEYSDGGVIFVFFFLSGVASISFAFMVSTFFSRASVAAAGGGVIFFLCFVPYLFVGNPVTYADLNQGAKVGLCLLAPSCLGIGGKVFSTFEEEGDGVTWSNVATKENLQNGGGTSMSVVFGMLIFDTLLYALITWYMENAFPGAYGVARPWYFFLTPSYWGCTKRTNANTANVAVMTNASARDERTAANANYEPDPRGLPVGISIAALTKQFDGATKPSVDSLSMNLYEGQITSLLGHNGAGKTTTIAMLTGLFEPTVGDAYVYGHSIRDDIEGVRKSLGICHQYDVLFDVLTVAETLEFFCRLKGVPVERINGEIDAMVADLQLEDKRDARAMTLSGGMKRKLCVGIALIGGSKTVMLDEPTAGMDPYARRATWDLILKHKPGRTIILTTHHMDEADLLGDRIAIMAAGKLQCVGTSLFLKSKYGVGYHMTIVKGHECNEAAVTALVKSHVPQGQLMTDVGLELSYVLPSESSPSFRNMFSEMDARSDEIGISSYGISVTTIEEVFLRVGERAEQAEEEGNIAILAAPGSRVQQKAPASAAPSSMAASDTSVLVEVDGGSGTEKIGGRRVEGRRALFSQQFRAMFTKRLVHSRRDKKAILAQLLAPVIFVLLGMIIVKVFPGKQDQKALLLTVNDIDPYAVYPTPSYKARTSFYQSANASAVSLVESIANVLNGYSSQPGDVPNPMLQVTPFTENAMESQLLLSYNSLRNQFGSYGSYSAVGTGTVGVNVTLWYQNEALHSPPIYLNVLTNALVQRTVPGASITTTNYPLPRSFSNKLDSVNQNGAQFSVGILFIFGLSFSAAYFVNFLVNERCCGAKHLQFLAGVDPGAYWLGSLAWDTLNYFLPLGAMYIVILIFQIDVYTGSNFGAIALLLLGFFWSMLPLMYVASFIPFSGATNAYISLTLANVIMGLGTVITCFTLDALDTAQSANDVLKWIFLVFPPFAMGNGIIQTANQASLNTYLTQAGYPSVAGPLTWNVCGKNIFFLGVSGFVYIALVYILERGWFSLSRRRDPKRLSITANVVELEPDEKRPYGEDDDVAAERARVEAATGAGEMVFVRNLSKVYPAANGQPPKRAVNNVSFGIPPNQCFGLLGINGAGKTTTFKMLTGDFPPTSGEAYLHGYSIATELPEVRKHIGYCPQAIDAMIEAMTGKELLTMFSRLRGIAPDDEKRVVSAWIARLQLEKYADVPCGTYSGGNKRKLSVAVALIGDPPIVFLDEPSAGVDAKARRFLWNTITNVVREGTSVVLTSHSMEECEALCSRLAIVVAGGFKCLGSPQHLKNKFGGAYEIAVKIGDSSEASRRTSAAVRTSGAEGITSFEGAIAVAVDTSAFEAFVSERFPGAIMKEKHDGFLRYEIGRRRGSSFIGGDALGLSASASAGSARPSASASARGSGAAGLLGPDPLPGNLSLSTIFGELEDARSKFSIEDYSVSQTTLEQVFIRFAKQQASS